MDFGIEGKTALVLSAGGGLGRAIAIALAKEGAKVAVTDVDVNSLAETAKQIMAAGGTVFSGTADLYDLQAINSLVDRVRREFGEVDILVNISGGPPPTPVSNVAAEVWTKQFQAMVLSMIHITDLVLPGMRSKGWGRIITSASSGVLSPIPNLGISNTLRSALVGWSKTLSREVAPDGITVNMVLPGRIATARIQQLDQARAVREAKTPDEVAKLSAETIPMRRYGTPAEYADVVAFLASARASYVTGTMVRVDGGMIPSV
jgi:3-oxoacyl-[acyl-carrier protein] reductase